MKSESSSNKRDPNIPTSISRDSLLPDHADLEFRAVNAKAIFDYLVKGFERDYMTKNFARYDSGWRSLNDVVNNLHLPISQVYAKKANHLSPPIRELLERGFVEKRFFQKERGRGGEVMRLRVAFENDVVKDIVEERIKHLYSSDKINAIAEIRAIKNETNQKRISEKLDKLRIAVLPLANFSPDPSDEYFADGLTEELISTMSKINGLQVIARTSAMSYKGKSLRIDEIAKELQTGSILEGSVRKAGGRIRITVQLIDPLQGDHLWTESYDRDLKDIFSVQSEISQSVAESLRVHLLKEEKERIQKAPTKDVEAYASYMQGIFHQNKGSKEGLQASIGHFQTAVTRDPTFALAYCGMSCSYYQLGFLGFISSSEAYPKAKEFAERALSIDEFLPQAHMCLADVLSDYEWDQSRAETEIRRALELKPNLADAHTYLAFQLKKMGRSDEAMEEIRKALELDPLSAINLGWVGTLLLFDGFVDDAIDALSKSLKENANNVFARCNLGLAYVRKGEYARGISEIENAIQLSEPKDTTRKAELAYAYVQAGMKDAARKILTELLELRENGQCPPMSIAHVYASLGEIDRAFEWLNRAVVERDAFILISLSFGDFPFEKMRSDPRYITLMRKIGLPVPK